MSLNKVAAIARDDQFSPIEIYSFEDSNMQGLFSMKAFSMTPSAGWKMKDAWKWNCTNVSVSSG